GCGSSGRAAGVCARAAPVLTRRAPPQARAGRTCDGRVHVLRGRAHLSPRAAPPPPAGPSQAREGARGVGRTRRLERRSARRLGLRENVAAIERPEETMTPVMTERDVDTLLRAYHDDGDTAARDQPVVELIPLV